MEIPKFSSREERKEWWAINGSSVKQEAQRAKAERMETDKQILSGSLDKNTRVVYIRLGHKPIGCLATRIEETETGKTMFFQFSAQNPCDRYNRAEGKRLALHRLETNPSSVIGTSQSTPYQLKYTASSLLAGDCVTYKFPTIVGYKLAENPRAKRKIREALLEWIEFRDKTDPTEEDNAIFNEASS